MSALDVTDFGPVSYDDDFALWAEQRAALLRQRDDGTLDRADLAGEIESLGRRERRELRTRMEVFVPHLIKWRDQPDQRSRSRSASIRAHRSEIAARLENNPSLAATRPDALERRYAKARERAIVEMGLPEPRRISRASAFTPENGVDAGFLAGAGPDERG